MISSRTIPRIVGIAAAANMHPMLPVSFFMVSRVVEQGQWNREKITVLRAVITVQPLFSRSCLSAGRLRAVMLSVERYAIMAMGMTISFAGKPRIKARSRTPSKPMSRAKGSRNSEQMVSREDPSMERFAMHQISSPAGAATETARPKTNRVRSSRERRITFPTCGMR